MGQLAGLDLSVPDIGKLARELQVSAACTGKRLGVRCSTVLLDDTAHMAQSEQSPALQASRRAFVPRLLTAPPCLTLHAYPAPAAAVVVRPRGSPARATTALIGPAPPCAHAMRAQLASLPAAAWYQPVWLSPVKNEEDALFVALLVARCWQPSLRTQLSTCWFEHAYQSVRGPGLLANGVHGQAWGCSLCSGALSGDCGSRKGGLLWIQPPCFWPRMMHHRSCCSRCHFGKSDKLPTWAFILSISSLFPIVGASVTVKRGQTPFQTSGSSTCKMTKRYLLLTLALAVALAGCGKSKPLDD